MWTASSIASLRSCGRLPLLRISSGVFGPDEEGTVAVPAVDESADLGVEVSDGAKGAAADGLQSMVPKKTSTRFSQLPEVGVKCTEIRAGRRPAMPSTRVVCEFDVIFHDQVQLAAEIGTGDLMKEP